MTTLILSEFRSQSSLPVSQDADSLEWAQNKSGGRGFPRMLRHVEHDTPHMLARVLNTFTRGPLTLFQTWNVEVNVINCQRFYTTSTLGGKVPSK